MIWLAVNAEAVAAVASPSEPAAAVETLEVVVRRPVVGDLTLGVQAYRPEFFTAVRPGTAMDMIRWLPGFTFEDTRDLRGLGAAGGNVLIDGQPPTSKTDTLATVLGRIPASQVERVDIIVGGAPGIDMRGRAVLANVVLKKTPLPRGSLTISDQQHEYGANAPELLLTASRKTDRTASETSLNLVQRVFHGPIFGAGPLVRTDGAGAVLFRAEEAVRAWGPMAVVTASHEFPFVAGKLRVNGSFRYMHAEFDDRIRLIDPVGRNSVKAVDDYSQAEAGLRYERIFGRATLESQLLRRHNVHDNFTSTRRPPSNSDLDEADTQDEAVARATLRFKRDETLTLEGSIEGARNGLDTTNDLLRNGEPAILPAANVSVRENRGELGALATWKPSTEWGLTGGVKVETSRLTAAGDVELSRNLTYVKPRVVVSWSPDKQTQLRVRGEHEVTQLNFFNFVAASEFVSGIIRAGNPNMRPQRSWIAEAVLEKQFWAGASLVGTIRYSAVRDVIDAQFLDEGEQVIALGNIGSGERWNLIGTVTLPLARFGLRGVTMKGTINYTPFVVTDPTTGERRQATGAPRWAGEAHLAHDLPGLRLNWGMDLTYSGRSALYRPTAVDRAASITRLVAFVEYRRSPTLNIRLEGANLLSPAPDLRVSVYGGAYHRAPLLYQDRRALDEGRYFTIRVRKTFN